MVNWWTYIIHCLTQSIINDTHLGKARTAELYYDAMHAQPDIEECFPYRKHYKIMLYYNMQLYTIGYVFYDF